LTASERVEPARQAWRKLTAVIEPSRWVWVDEFGSNTGLTRRFARAPRGERAHATAPRNHGTNRTTISSLTLAGLGPGLILDEAMTTRGFEAYVQHVLAPTLQPGQIVGLDNLRQHKSGRVRELIEARGASIWFLPTYSPDPSAPLRAGFQPDRGGLLEGQNAAPKRGGAGPRDPGRRDLGRAGGSYADRCPGVLRSRRVRTA
jgi:hypothetical protein